MTKRILLVGITKGGTGPTSGIMTKVMDQIEGNCEIYFCGYDPNTPSLDDKYNLCLSDPRRGISTPALRYRIRRKIHHLLQWDDCTLGSQTIFTHLQKYAHLNFDLVIGIAGIFSFVEAAYQFARQNHLPLKLAYFDPFTNNSLAKNIKKREKLEQRWLSYAEKLYYNLENLVPAHLQKCNKLVGFHIPMFPQPLTTWTQDNALIYGGSFYKGIREPELLYRFANSVKNSRFSIECYSNLKYYPKDSNIHFAPMLNRKQFEQKCLSARGLIYIGNSDKNLKSSKYLEYIIWHKPIIGVNVEQDNEVRKYKYYVNENDPKLIEKLKSITQAELLAYDPLLDFPNRDPKVLAEELFRVEPIKKDVN